MEEEMVIPVASFRIKLEILIPDACLFTIIWSGKNFLNY